MIVNKALDKAVKFGAKQPIEVADDHNIFVHYIPLGKNTYGIFNKTGSCIQIAINSNLSPGKQEFVLAHELGHALMHHNIKQLHCTKYKIYSKDKLEYEANEFAIRLLWDEFTYYSIEDFCRIHELEKSVIKQMFGGIMEKRSII